MESYLIETYDDKYEVSDGQAHSSIQSFITNDYQTDKIKDIFRKYADIAGNIRNLKTKNNIKECSLRWLGIENNKIELGYKLLFDNEQEEIGKAYCEDTEKLLKELKKFL